MREDNQSGILKLAIEKGRADPFHAVLMLGNAIFFIANSLFLVQGFFTRYRADDYCFSGILEEKGLIGGLTAFYKTTSNRFSAFIFAWLTELLGRTAIRWVPAITMLLFILLLYRIFSIILQTKRGKKPAVAFFLAQVFFFFYILLAPNRAQSVYWRSGLSHYFFPLIIGLLMAQVLLRDDALRAYPILKWAAMFLLAFFGAGFSETYAALQAVFFLLWMAVLLIGSKRSQNIKCIIACAAVVAGSFAAMGFMMLAPGNALRLQTLNQAPDVYTIIRLSVTFAQDYVEILLKGFWLPITVVFVIFMMVGYELASPPHIENERFPILLIIVLLIAATWVMVLAVFAPTAYGMMSFPEKRVLMLANFPLMLCFAGLGFLFGLPIGRFVRLKPIILAVVLLLLALYPLQLMREQMADIKFNQHRARLWDQQALQIANQRMSGQSDLEVSALDSEAEIAEMSADPVFWVNRCAAQFYQVDSIVAIEE